MICYIKECVYIYIYIYIQQNIPAEACSVSCIGGM